MVKYNYNGGIGTIDDLSRDSIRFRDRSMDFFSNFSNTDNSILSKLLITQHRACPAPKMNTGSAPDSFPEKMQNPNAYYEKMYKDMRGLDYLEDVIELIKDVGVGDHVLNLFNSMTRLTYDALNAEVKLYQAAVGHSKVIARERGRTPEMVVSTIEGISEIYRRMFQTQDQFERYFYFEAKKEFNLHKVSVEFLNTMLGAKYPLYIKGIIALFKQKAKKSIPTIEAIERHHSEMKKYIQTAARQIYLSQGTPVRLREVPKAVAILGPFEELPMLEPIL